MQNIYNTLQNALSWMNYHGNKTIKHHVTITLNIAHNSPSNHRYKKFTNTLLYREEQELHVLKNKM